VARPAARPAISGATATYAGVLSGVDLVVTADDQGGFADTIVIHNAAAAANPALAPLKLTYTATGLVLSADAAGNLVARADPAAPAAITTQAPLAWDSAPAPAGMATVTGPDGTAVDAANGLPAYSSVTAPGVAAHVAAVPVTLSANTITLTPPASALTGPGVTYPVYVDPTWHNTAATNAAAWTQVDSGFATTSYWDESSDLQVGDCPSSITPPSQSCNGMGVARSFIRMPISSALTKTTDVHSADLYMDEVWAPSCTAEPVRLYTAGGITSATTWNSQGTRSSSYLTQNAAFGYPGCGSYKNDITWNVTSTVASDASSGTSTQWWELIAGSESAQLDWKQFQYGSAYFTLSVVYNYPPGQPTRSTSPGGACFFSASGAPVIGNDDVTFNAVAYDNDGDSNLTTRFIIINSSGATVYDSASKGTNVVTGDHATAELLLSRSVMQGLQTGGTTTQYTYHWYALVTDEFGLSSATPVSDCYFTYNPLGPAAPTVSVPSSGTLGQQVTATFTAPAGCSASGNPCPASYSYQLGASPPVTVTDNSGSNWTGNITINQAGPIQLTVYGTASGGNPGEAATAEIQGTTPTIPYQDGHFTGGTYPDLLTIGTGAKPSLWLSTGSGPGTLNPAVDIGSLGTAINAGADGPGDWAGAIVLHGDFTGDNVQDVMAYYPSGASQGTGTVIAGNGNASTLEPDFGYPVVSPGLMQNLVGAYPVQLVAAGNASGIGTGFDDLIGISGNTTSPNNYELDLYTNGSCAGCAYPGGYGYDETLTITSPDGTSDWDNYTIATAGNPASTVLFALDTANGDLYECTSPIALAAGTGTWASITVPWGSSPPKLVSADINHAGQTELWTLTGTSATGYTLSGTALTAEAAGTPVKGPSNDWPLTDGSDLAQTDTATTAVDTITGSAAALSPSGASWSGDDYFNADIGLSGTGYVTPPAATVPDTDTTPSISVWFKTTTASGVLVSLQSQTVSAGSTITGGYDPVLYVGTDGKLNADWWPAGRLTSLNPVDDGLWHHAVLTAGSGSQTLQLDGQLQGTASGSPTLTFANPTNLTFGTGYVGGNWPDEPHYSKTSNTGYIEYFTGQIADATFTQ
jgi:hypothetical protein